MRLQSDINMFETGFTFTRPQSDMNIHEIEFIGFQSDVDISETELTTSKIIEEPSDTKRLRTIGKIRTIGKTQSWKESETAIFLERVLP